MINKNGVWFVTLFSLILVLSIYYITMPNELLSKNTKKEIVTKSNKKTTSVKETSSLVAMRVSLEEERQEQMVSLQEKLTNEKTTTEEKNNAYEQLKYLNQLQGQEEKIEKQNIKLKRYEDELYNKRKEEEINKKNKETELNKKQHELE